MRLLLIQGVGIVGKEGKQASLAADFSINQFSYLTKLLLWHGRNSYKRSAKLSQFVIHRGLIIAVIQAVFSSIFFFARESCLHGNMMKKSHGSHCALSGLAASRVRYSVYNGSSLFACIRPGCQ